MTSAAPNPVVVVVPGVGDSGPAHWQTLLQQKTAGSVRVVQHDWAMPVRDEWVDGISRTLESIAAPVLLVGHSAGSVAIVHWASRCQHQRGVVAALLVAPADLETDLPDGTPVEFLDDAGWVPCPRTRLPFASVLVASTDDPYASFERSREYATAWGSRLVRVEHGGHLNADAGFGPWPLVDDLLRELLAAAR